MSKSPRSPYSPACGKIAHPSRKIAQLAVRRMLQKLDEDGKDRPILLAYQCDFCALWHTGNESSLKQHRNVRRAPRVRLRIEVCE